MSEKYVLAIDQSTQGTKAILFDGQHRLVCRSDIPHKQYVDGKGWVSHDLEEIYRNTVQAVKRLVEEARVSRSDIACIGISNQRETSAAWNRRTGEALAPAVVWQCARAEGICERIRRGVDARRDRDTVRGAGAGRGRDGGQDVAEIIRRKTGLMLSPYFPAAKFAWLQENVEAVRRAGEEGELCFGTIDSWLLYRLTKGAVYATDYSNASRTQLFNINTLEWDEEICAWFGIRRDNLPQVRDSSYLYGSTDLEGWFGDPVPICGVIGDSQGALFGQGCVKKGMVKATYGTGSSVMMYAGEKPVQPGPGLVTSLAWGIDGKTGYVLEGNINYTGAVITWLKDDVRLISSAQETEGLASQANREDTAYLVPAFSGLGAPYWKPEAKAVLCGMSRTTGKKEIVKAALESIAYQIADVAEIMKEENGGVLESLCVDGGPTGNAYLMQFQSDILGIPVKLPGCEESSALGAAMLAGLGHGVYRGKNLFTGTPKGLFCPRMERPERENRYLGWKNAVGLLS